MLLALALPPAPPAGAAPLPPAPLADPAPPAARTRAELARAALSNGDLAWWSGDRGAAVAAWRHALALVTPAGPDAAADTRPAAAAPRSGTAPPTAAPPAALEAMARVRLLQLGGNVGPFVHEAKLDAALAACPAAEPWCAIAAADRDLFLPAFVGADPRRVPRTLAGSPLAGPAAARIAVALGDLAPLAALSEDALDGMGRGLRTTGRVRPPAPGTWVLGVGIGGAPGAGVGLLLRFVHPDLAWRAHRLEVQAGADTRGGVFGAASLRTATRPAWGFGLAGTRAVGDVYVDGTGLTYALATGRASAAVAPRVGWVAVQLGASGRVDALGALSDAEGGALAVAFGAVPGLDGAAMVAGPLAAVTLGNLGGDGLRLAVDTSFGAYTHAGLSADWRAHTRLLGGELALRLAATHVPTDSPFYRLPTAGGADLLRGLPAGRFRDPTLLAGQAEYRRPIVGPLHGAVFVDSAWIEGPHLTAGGGVRIVLPPARENVTRLDAGFGPEGWGVVAAWGEAF